VRRRMTTTLTTTALGLAVALSTASPSLAATGTTAGERVATPGASAPEQCQTIDFEKAAVTPLATTGTTVRNRLTVTGQKPAANVRVTLVPVVYIKQPDFWEITVTGCSSGIGLPVLTPYTATFDFTGSLGRCGIEVAGATRRQQFDLAGCSSLLAGAL